MDMSLDVQTRGLFDFGSFTHDFWNLQEAEIIGESLFNDVEFSKVTENSSDNNNNNKNNNNKRKKFESKNMAALKSHCEAERRRRERINSHLSNLRNFVPSTDKMDKATLLGEVISQVKELKKQASESTKGVLIPTDVDEIIVTPYDDTHSLDNNVLTFKVSVCSEYKPEIIPSLRRAINDLKLNIVKAEISTLGSRVKNVFTVSGKKDEIGYSKKEKFGKCIYKALEGVVEKICPLEEYSPRTIYPSKRRRVSS